MVAPTRDILQRFGKDNTKRYRVLQVLQSASSISILTGQERVLVRGERGVLPFTRSWSGRGNLRFRLAALGSNASVTGAGLEQGMQNLENQDG